MSKNIERIKKLEKNHQLLSENLIDAIWAVDAETLRFEYMTASIEKISGYTSDEYLGSPIQDKLTPESFQKISTLLADEIQKVEKGIRKTRTVEVELLHKNGSRYWSEIRAKILQEPGEGMKIIGVTRDITEKKKAEIEKTHLIEKLEQTLMEKEKLIKENKLLQGLLRICGGCKRIRDEKGIWWPLDKYVE